MYCKHSLSGMVNSLSEALKIFEAVCQYKSHSKEKGIMAGFAGILPIQAKCRNAVRLLVPVI